MKKALLFFLVIGLFSCSNPTKTELLDYINNKIVVASGWETKAIRAYEEVSGANYKSDSLMYLKIQSDVKPNYTTFCKELEKFQAELTQPELVNLHKKYIEGANLQLKGFGLITEALEKQDTVIIANANECLNKGRTLIDEWRAGLDSVCKKYDVTLTK
ncbi:MAG: hypothetical protein LCH32_12365 [Bacteroidetes bacterium]|nr:hypothetical protein [Bacteroidota bacterium]